MEMSYNNFCAHFVVLAKFGAFQTVQDNSYCLNIPMEPVASTHGSGATISVSGNPVEPDSTAACPPKVNRSTNRHYKSHKNPMRPQYINEYMKYYPTNFDHECMAPTPDQMVELSILHAFRKDTAHRTNKFECTNISNKKA